MSTEATLDPGSQTYVNDVSAGGIMSRYNAAMSNQQDAPPPEPAADTQEPEQDNTPAQTTEQSAPAPEPTPVEDDGLKTPLSDLGKTEEEPKKDDPDTPTSGPQTQAAKYKWGELRKKADELDEIKNTLLPQREKELAEFKAKVEELSKVDPSLYEKQLQEKEAAIAEYEKKLAVHDIRESKQFREEVLAPMAEIGTSVEVIARQYEIDPETIKSALLLTDPVEQEKKLMELADGMHARHQAKLFDFGEKVFKLNARAEELENNAQEARKELDFIKEQEARKQQEERQTQVKVKAEAVKKQMLSKIDVLGKNEELAKKVFSAEVTPEDPTMMAYNAYAGAALPAILTELANARVKLAELEKSVAARSAVQPRSSGTAPAAAPSGDGAPVEGETLWQRMKNFQSMQAR